MKLETKKKASKKTKNVVIVLNQTFNYLQR